MADSIDVLVTLGYDHALRHDLDSYLTGEIPGEAGQSLDCIAGGEYNPRNLRGSGQAGTVRVYAGLIRRGSVDGVLEWLTAAPWGRKHAVVVIWDSFHDGPLVAALDQDRIVTLRQPEVMF